MLYLAIDLHKNQTTVNLRNKEHRNIEKYIIKHTRHLPEELFTMFYKEPSQ